MNNINGSPREKFCVLVNRSRPWSFWKVSVTACKGPRLMVGDRYVVDPWTVPVRKSGRSQARRR